MYYLSRDLPRTFAAMLILVVQRIILVGGFGSSAYLNKALTEWCLENGNIKLLCPEEP